MSLPRVSKTRVQAEHVRYGQTGTRVCFRPFLLNKAGKLLLSSRDSCNLYRSFAL